MEHSEDLNLPEYDHKSPRPRSATELNLSWIAERVRKSEALKREIEEESYQVDSLALARSLFGVDQD